MPENTGVKVLFLGASDSPLLDWLVGENEEVLQTAERISVDFVRGHGITHIVSYGYRHIIRKDVLNALPDRCVNLHISLLPWNRGADPNLWSFLEGTPKGVTVHFIDEGVDTGDIIGQREVSLDQDGTLASTYAELHIEIMELFKLLWSDIRDGTCSRTKQKGEGTLHRVKDKEGVSHLLTDGWNTRVGDLVSGA